MFRPQVFTPPPLVRKAPDNASILAQMARNARQRRNRPMGEYMQELPHRVMITKGPATTDGPVSAPTMLGPDAIPESQVDLLKEILREIRRAPARFSQEAQDRFGIPPREGIWFDASNAGVTVPAGQAVSVVAQTVQERFTGFLEYVGVNVTGGSFADITWQIRVGNPNTPNLIGVHPEYANRVFSQNTINNPDRFRFELTQNRTVQLVAINSAAVDIDVEGKLVGWTEFMSDWKDYGSSPQSGVA